MARLHSIDPYGTLVSASQSSRRRSVAEVPLGEFESLGEDAKALLREHGRVRNYPANSVIYYQDDPAQSFYIVLSGAVRLSYVYENGHVSLFSLVPPGYTLGAAGVVEREDRCETASTAGDTRLLTVDGSLLRRQTAGSDELRQALAQQVYQRYRDHVLLTRALYLPSLAQRLAYSITLMADGFSNMISYKGRSVACLSPILTQRDLGAMVRGTRENVNKTLKKWERTGLIALEDRHILVLDPEALERVAMAMDI